MVYVASIYSPREIVGFMAALAAGLAAPFVYGGWNADGAAVALANFLIWCAVAGITHVLMSRVRTQRHRMRLGAAEAREEARIDGLTGVGNRRAFEEAIANEIARTSRTGVPLSMAMGDIEGFKRINDRWGHVEGDECLRSVARLLADALRSPTAASAGVATSSHCCSRAHGAGGGAGERAPAAPRRHRRDPARRRAADDPLRHRRR